MDDVTIGDNVGCCSSGVSTIVFETEFLLSKGLGSPVQLGWPSHGAISTISASLPSGENIAALDFTSVLGIMLTQPDFTALSLPVRL